jgi:hypothetical protein
VLVNSGVLHNRLSLRQISKKSQISNRMKKSLMSLVVISYSLKSLKIPYANGRVSVRIFYKNNLISFLSTRFQFLYMDFYILGLPTLYDVLYLNVFYNVVCKQYVPSFLTSLSSGIHSMDSIHTFLYTFYTLSIHFVLISIRRRGTRPPQLRKCPYALDEVLSNQTLLSSLFDKASLSCVKQ